jgi:hypothetical protein
MERRWNLHAGAQGKARLSIVHLHLRLFASLKLNPQLSTFLMKSAYELAMERLEKQAPTRTLTAEQKAEIADLESSAKAKIAEQELFLKGQIEKAIASGSDDEARQLEQQLAREIRRIQDDCEAKKEKVRAK